jgi:hypothetical protein
MVIVRSYSVPVVVLRKTAERPCEKEVARLLSRLALPVVQQVQREDGPRWTIVCRRGERGRCRRFCGLVALLRRLFAVVDKRPLGRRMRSRRIATAILFFRPSGSGTKGELGGDGP